MTKRLMMALATVGCLLVMGSANALVLVFTLDPQNPLTPVGSKYHVTMSTTDNITWSYSVTGDPLNPPGTHEGDQISFGFRDSGGNLIPVASPGLALLSGPVVIWSPNTPGSTTAQHNNTFGSGFGIHPLGANTLTDLAPIVLSAPTAASVAVTLQDGNQQWFHLEPFGVIPEPASVMLLLSGGAPLGLLLRRRRNLVA